MQTIGKWSILPQALNNDFVLLYNNCKGNLKLYSLLSIVYNYLNIINAKEVIKFLVNNSILEFDLLEYDTIAL